MPLSDRPPLISTKTLLARKKAGRTASSRCLSELVHGKHAALCVDVSLQLSPSRRRHLKRRRCSPGGGATLTQSRAQQSGTGGA